MKISSIHDFLGSIRIQPRTLPNRRKSAPPTPTPQLLATVLANRGGICDAMERCGGSFAQGLAIALRRADPINTRRLCEALPDLITPYCPGGKFFQPTTPCQ